MKYTYTNIQTGKIRWTRGAFSGWTRGGPVNARYAIFQLRSGAIYVPDYLLTKETREVISKIEVGRALANAATKRIHRECGI